MTTALPRKLLQNILKPWITQGIAKVKLTSKDAYLQAELARLTGTISNIFPTGPVASRKELQDNLKVYKELGLTGINLSSSATELLYEYNFFVGIINGSLVPTTPPGYLVALEVYKLMGATVPQAAKGDPEGAFNVARSSLKGRQILSRDTLKFV